MTEQELRNAETNAILDAAVARNRLENAHREVGAASNALTEAEAKVRTIRQQVIAEMRASTFTATARSAPGEV